MAGMAWCAGRCVCVVDGPFEASWWSGGGRLQRLPLNHQDGLG